MYIAKLEKKMNWQKSANQIIFNSNFVTIIEVLEELSRKSFFRIFEYHT